MQKYKDDLEILLKDGVSKIDAAHDVILKIILENRFRAGQVISERRLSDDLGISRTPVRAALNRLYYEGYVDMKSDVCTIVAELGIQDIIELYEIREGLECKAIELFVARKTPEEEQELVSCFEHHKAAVAAGDNALARDMDNELHLIIARGSKNKRLYDALSAYIALSQRSVEIGSSYAQRYDRTLPQHKQIVDAVISGDATESANAIRAHIIDAREYFKLRFIELL